MRSLSCPSLICTYFTSSESVISYSFHWSHQLDLMVSGISQTPNRSQHRWPCVLHTCACEEAEAENTEVSVRILLLLVSSLMSDSVAPWTAHRAPLSFIISWSLLGFMSIESLMLSNHLILCRPLPLLPSVFPSFRAFSESALHLRWPKYWSVIVSISPSSEYSGLISFTMDWFDLLAVQGTL